jgi:peroxiredoxin
VFAIAAVGKLADPAGSRQAARDFGASERLAAIAGRLLPLVELAVAAALLPAATSRPAALAALALLGLFAVQIVRALSRGVKPECHCFGKLHSSPASWSIVIRECLLGGLAGFVLVAGSSRPGASAPRWLSRLSDAEMIAAALAVTEGALLLLLGAFSLRLLRRYGQVLMRLEELESGIRHRGLSVGSEAPEFFLPTLDGKGRSLGEVLEPGPALLVFSDPGCGPCVALLPEVARWQAEHGAILQPILITSGGADINRAVVQEHGLNAVLWDEQRDVARAYRADGTPAAVVVSRAGRIASVTVLGGPAINRLVLEAVDAASITDLQDAGGRRTPYPNPNRGATNEPPGSGEHGSTLTPTHP